MRVFGIDCGTEFTGYGVVEVDETARNLRLEPLCAGAIKLNKKRPTPMRLAQVYAELTALMEMWEPQELAIEDVFFAANAKSALKLGHVRGARCWRRRTAGFPVAEYAPLSIKERGGGLRAGGEGASAVYGGAAAGSGARSGAGGRGGRAGNCDLPHTSCADGGGVAAMRRAVAALLMLSGLILFAPKAAAGGSALKWTAVELSMIPRSDQVSPPWKVRLQADGAGSYSEGGSADAKQMPFLAVSAATLQRLQQGEHAAKSGKCETKAKNVAKTGEKTIRYEADEKTAECTFNYSDDVGLMGATAAFLAIADTMQRGERLQHDLRYDRLGLDAEMESRVAAQNAGSAI